MDIDLLLHQITEGKPFLDPLVNAFPASPPRTALLLSLVEAAVQKPQEPLQVLEIGSWVGTSALVLAEGLQRFNDEKGQVFCCDYWEKTDGVEYLDGRVHVHNSGSRVHVPNLGPQSIYRVFMYNLRVSGYHRLVTPIMGDSRIVASALRDDSFDLVYVDGCHGYATALCDIQNAQRLLKAGGVLAGHDLELQLSECDLAALHEQAEQDSGTDPRTGQPYHPGVTLAVGNALGLAQPFQSVWAFRKTADRFISIDISILPRYVPNVYPAWAAQETSAAFGLSRAA